MSKKLYNLIMHSDPEFWSGQDGYVDFPKDRFLEYTGEDLKNELSSLDQDVITRLKKLPTLFAAEHEVADTRVGKVTEVEVLPRKLRVHYEFNEKQSQLGKGALESPELDINTSGYELYRTHWAVKECDISGFLKQRSSTLEGIFDHLKQDLDIPHPEKPYHTKITVLYACNSSGKTRISKRFADMYEDKVLYYNAFTEDLFQWDNDDFTLNFKKQAWIFRTIDEQGITNRIIENFQNFTGSELEPLFDFSSEQITFRKKDGENIKISRGEESIFVWAIFYTILEVGIDELNSKPDDRSTQDFDDIQYIVIDDPVSSMDDTRIVTVALELAKLIKKSKSQLKFLISTHHALFFNVLFNVRSKKWDRKNYILSRSDDLLTLKSQGNESPFAYHHVAMLEIRRALDKDEVKKYHFNIFRALLEKTANFLGYDHWKKCLEDNDHTDAFAKIIDHYSHDRLSAMEYQEIRDDEKLELVTAFDFFVSKYDFKQVLA